MKNFKEYNSSINEGVLSSVGTALSSIGKKIGSYFMSGLNRDRYYRYRGLGLPRDGENTSQSSDSKSQNTASQEPSQQTPIAATPLTKQDKKDKKDAARTIDGETYRIGGKEIEANNAARQKAKEMLGSRMVAAGINSKKGVTRRVKPTVSDPSLRALNRDIELSKVADIKAGATSLYGDNLSPLVQRRLELVKKQRLLQAKNRTGERKTMGFYESKKMLDSILAFIK